MRVFLGADHAGFELKRQLVGWLHQQGHEPVDCGATSYAPEDDYPPYVLRAAERVGRDPGSMGIVIGGSGNGEAIAANKVAGVRAAVVWSEESAALARLHNDANVISLGARFCDAEQATQLVRVFLDSPFSGAERHARRVAMLARFEETGELPPLPDAP